MMRMFEMKKKLERSEGKGESSTVIDRSKSDYSKSCATTRKKKKKEKTFPCQSKKKKGNKREKIRLFTLPCNI